MKYYLFILYILDELIQNFIEILVYKNFKFIIFSPLLKFIIKKK